MGGIVEAFVEGENKRSPSCQCRVNAIGGAQAISTHDQVLGGPSGQVFLGCTFPADDVYRLDIQNSGYAGRRGLGSQRRPRSLRHRLRLHPDPDGSWKHYAIEVNLRKGGTTHPFPTLRFLTDGNYDMLTGEFYAQNAKPKYYYASDTLQSDRYKGLSPDDLIDISVYHDLHFHANTERGVVFHLMGRSQSSESWASSASVTTLSRRSSCTSGPAVCSTKRLVPRTTESVARAQEDTDPTRHGQTDRRRTRVVARSDDEIIETITVQVSHNDVITEPF